METLFSSFLKTRIGFLKITTTQNHVVSLDFVKQSAKIKAPLNKPTLLKECETQLLEYFKGERKTFDLKLSQEGTDFQKKVWKALQKIKYGQTASYKDIAQKINAPKAYRAVGLANNKNPLPIIVPCHRVVGSKGDLVGYAGGLELKKALLALETGHFVTIKTK